MSQQKIKILLTNDDGIDSPGLQALYDSVKDLGEIFIMAPDKQQSAVSHALTISTPLRVNKHFKNGAFFGYTLNGTPTDCVKIAITTILGEKPDMVISGINHGQNTSINTMYSGTVAGATEGMLFGIPSFAISVSSHSLKVDLKNASFYSNLFAKKLLSLGIPRNTFLNINIPDIPENEIKGIKATRLANSYWKDYYIKRQDPAGRDYFWFAGDYITEEENLETDDTAIAGGYVSVSPLRIEFTDFDFLEKLKRIEL